MPSPDDEQYRQEAIEAEALSLQWRLEVVIRNLTERRSAFPGMSHTRDMLTAILTALSKLTAEYEFEAAIAAVTRGNDDQEYNPCKFFNRLVAVELDRLWQQELHADDWDWEPPT